MLRMPTFGIVMRVWTLHLRGYHSRTRVYLILHNAHIPPRQLPYRFRSRLPVFSVLVWERDYDSTSWYRCWIIGWLLLRPYQFDFTMLRLDRPGTTRSAWAAEGGGGTCNSGAIRIQIGYVMLCNSAFYVHCMASRNLLMSSRFPNMEVIATTIYISIALGSTRELHAPLAAHALLALQMADWWYMYRIVRIISPWCIISPPPSSAQSSCIGIHM